MKNDYPRMMFHYSHDPVTVNSEEEESALGAEWSRTIVLALPAEDKPAKLLEPEGPEEEPELEEPEPEEELEPEEEPEEQQVTAPPAKPKRGRPPAQKPPARTATQKRKGGRT